MNVKTSRRDRSILSSPVLFDGLGILFIFVFILMTPPLASDPGAGWHLKTGQWIVENWQIPHHDPFLWSTEGREWIANQWLSDVVLWLIYRTGGWDALAIFCFCLPLLAMIWVQGRILYNYNQSNGSSLHGEHKSSLLINSIKKLAPVAALGLSLMVAWVQWIVRPVIFSFVLFSIIFYLIWLVTSDRISKRKFLVIVPAIFALWANLHSAFPLGFFLLLCAAIAAVFERDSASYRLFSVTLLFSFIATLINPYGYKLHGNILALVGDPYFMKLNNEWLSPSFSDTIFIPLAISLAILVFMAGAGLRSSLWLRFVTALFALLSLKGVRYTPFFGLILPTTLLQRKSINLNSSSSIMSFTPWGSILLSSSLLIFSLFSSPGPENSFSSKILENKEMWQAIEATCERSGGRIYNHPDLGGAITFMLYPKCRAGMDDRNELNGVAAYKKFFEISKGELMVQDPDFPGARIIECDSTLVSLAKKQAIQAKLTGEFERFCILESD